MTQRVGELCQVLRAQSEDYWKRLVAFKEKHVEGSLVKVDFECLKHGFTLHGIKHAQAVENLLERLIPSELLENEYHPRDNPDAFAPEELFILLLAAWSHDLGMEHPEQRRIHNCLSRDLIWDSQKPESQFPWYLPSNFAFCVGQLCYAHRDHQREDGTRVDTLSEIKDVSALGEHGNRVRLRLLAALLRLADELDVVSYRAPEDVMYIINLSEDSARHWVENLLINGVVIDSIRLTISLIPFEPMVNKDPIYKELVDARCLKIQKELDGMGSILRDYPFLEYREVFLDKEPIRSIRMRHLLDYQVHSIEKYKDVTRDLMLQVKGYQEWFEKYAERFEGLAYIAQQLEGIAESCRRLAVPLVFPSRSLEITEVVNVLVVAGDADWRNELEKAIGACAERVVQAGSISKAIQEISEQDFAIIVTELNLDTERAGFDVLAAAKEAGQARGSYTPVIVLAPQGNPKLSSEAMVNGAYDCLEYTSRSADFVKGVQAKLNKAIDFRARERERKGQL